MIFCRMHHVRFSLFRTEMNERDVSLRRASLCIATHERVYVRRGNIRLAHTALSESGQH